VTIIKTTEIKVPDAVHVLAHEEEFCPQRKVLICIDKSKFWSG
jgi:hypothetical protein